MRQALADYPELAMQVEEISGGVSITFRQTAKTSHVGVDGGVSGGVSGGVNGGVTDAQDMLLLIGRHPGANATSLAALACTSKRTVERWLKQLKDQGLIEFRGAPKTGGYFIKPRSAR
jgi:ATP-dependent DNA helicase RecG